MIPWRKLRNHETDGWRVSPRGFVPYGIGQGETPSNSSDSTCWLLRRRNESKKTTEDV
jgi:hypothetical protein